MEDTCSVHDKLMDWTELDSITTSQFKSKIQQT